MNKKLIILAVSSLLLLSIPITLFLMQENQEARSRANTATSLYFSPDSSANEPLQKNIGDKFPLDIMIQPGEGLVSFVKLQIAFNPAQLKLDSTNPFTINTDAFPVTMEGPIVTEDSLSISMSIGADPSKAIQSPVRVGTLYFEAVGPTESAQTQVTFSPLTQVLSVSASNQSSENILSTILPAIISIKPNPTPTVTPSPTLIPSPTLTPSPTHSPTPTPTNTPSPTPTNGRVTFLINGFLDGIGARGDNTNPSGTMSNKNPLHKDRAITFEVYNANSELIADVEGTMNYSSISGAFHGSVTAIQAIPSGNYTIKVKTNAHLTRLIPGIQNLLPGQVSVLPNAIFVAGDIISDNKLNILDYNALIDCYSDLQPAIACADENKKIYSDLNDDGAVNQFDYNLFLREIATQPGE